MKERNSNVSFVEMVDVSKKKIVHRRATATGKIILKKQTIDAIKKGEIKKGNPLPIAEVSGILAAKKTYELIPLCHPIPLTKVDLTFKMAEDYVEAQCSVTADYKTGVEMEALTGVTTALLTIWDMVKYLEKDENGQYPTTKIMDVKVVEKTKDEKHG